MSPLCGCLFVRCQKMHYWNTIDLYRRCDTHCTLSTICPATGSTRWPHLQVALPTNHCTITYRILPDDNPQLSSCPYNHPPTQAATGLHHFACGYWQMYIQLFLILFLSYAWALSFSFISPLVSAACYVRLITIFLTCVFAFMFYWAAIISVFLPNFFCTAL